MISVNSSAYECRSSDNPASGRVMEKCGMRKEGVLRQRLYNKGKFVDVALYAILKDDARPARRAPAR